jgi:hypothetical protein
MEEQQEEEQQEEEQQEEEQNNQEDDSVSVLQAGTPRAIIDRFLNFFLGNKASISRAELEAIIKHLPPKTAKSVVRLLDKSGKDGSTTVETLKDKATKLLLDFKMRGFSLPNESVERAIIQPATIFDVNATLPIKISGLSKNELERAIIGTFSSIQSAFGVENEYYMNMGQYLYELNRKHGGNNIAKVILLI